MNERRVRIVAIVTLAAFLGACAGTGKRPGHVQGMDRTGAILIGAGIGATLLGATSAVTVAGMEEGDSKQNAYYVGVPLAAVAGAGLGAIVAWLLGDTPAVAPAKAAPQVSVPLDPDAEPPLAQTQAMALILAREYEAEGRWALAWGAYHRAWDLGPPTEFIQSKMNYMESKLGVPAGERRK